MVACTTSASFSCSICRLCSGVPATGNSDSDDTGVLGAVRAVAVVPDPLDDPLELLAFLADCDFESDLDVVFETVLPLDFAADFAAFDEEVFLEEEAATSTLAPSAGSPSSARLSR